VRALRIAVALCAALALQTLLAHAMGNRTVIDLVTVSVIYFALGTGPGAGIVMGSLAGLAQDVLSGGVIGVSGFASCLVAFAAGAVGTQFIVTGALSRFVVFVAGSALQAALVIGLYALIQPRGFGVPPATVAAQALLNGVAGVLAFYVVERAPQALERRRMRRAHVRSRRLSN
jgi:rod shape-determining protein MreD